jgi:hypothetical protein
VTGQTGANSIDSMDGSHEDASSNGFQRGRASGQSVFLFFFLFRSRLGVVMKPRESIDYAVECVILLLWGGIIVDWIFSAAPPSA